MQLIIALLDALGRVPHSNGTSKPFGEGKL